MVDILARSVALVNEAVEATNTAFQAKHEATLAILDRLPTGVILVGHGCEVHETNERAREILSLNDGIQIHRRALKAESSSVTLHLHRVVALALEPHNGFPLPGEDVIVLSRPSGLLDFIALVSLLTANQDVLGEPLAVIFLSETSRPLHIDPRRLTKIFGFTPAEARLASLLVQGLCLTDAATYLGVSLNTLKTHLKRVFYKTGCDRQSELVRIILSVNPITPNSESKEPKMIRSVRCPTCDSQHAYPLNGALDRQCMDCDTVYIAKDS